MRQVPPLDRPAQPALPFPQALTQARLAAEEHIEAELLRQSGVITDAMGYAVRGGKGLRGFLVLEGARLHGLHPDQAIGGAAAIEALHAYSLVHDDLPCMDDDDLRRGQPTVHRKWDEATAVLAGDALQTLAFRMLADSGLPPERIVDLVLSLADAAGVGGMVGGQALDIAAETAAEPLTLDQIIALQAGKTGALITWSAMAGPRMAGANAGHLQDYGDALGLAFQIWDDVLDVEGDAAKMGKAVQKDAGRGKATFVSLLGLDGAKRRAAGLIDAASDALSVYGADGDCLRQAARFVIARET